MPAAIGIDLGTTNSVAAIKLAETEVITADDNTPPERKLTRSIVSIYNNELVVGETAYNQFRSNPANVIFSIKRLMGRGINDPAVQQHIQNVPYKVTQFTQGTENALSVWINEQEFLPEDISAEILKKVVRNSQEYLRKNHIGNDTINQAVVTVPAYFNDSQRSATRRACQKAGLTLLELLPEPTAAAISYGFKPNSSEFKTILVYDFGGGTFDASVIQATGSMFIELGKAGDLWLGGDDIDHKITQFVKSKVTEQEGLDDFDQQMNKMPHYQKLKFISDLKNAIERAKIALSSKDEVVISPATPLLDDNGFDIPIEVKIRRSELEAMIKPYVDRTIQICHQALSLSEFFPSDIDVVLMVGGSSQIPYVQQSVREAFGNKVVIHPRPMYAVAEGAAIVAAGLVDKTTTVSRDYCIELESDPRYKVISKGEQLPCQKIETFKTVADDQRLIHLKFFSPDLVRDQLDSGEAQHHDEPIGEMWLGLDKPYPKGTEIVVTFELNDKNENLSATAWLKNDPSIRVSSSFTQGRANEKIYRELSQSIDEINAEISLTKYGLSEIQKEACEVIFLANQIEINNIENQDILVRATEKLEDFKFNNSPAKIKMDSIENKCDNLLKLYDFLLDEDQKLRIQNIKASVQKSIQTKNLSTEKIEDDYNKEMNLLPKLVKGLEIIREGAISSSSTELSTRFIKLLELMRQGNFEEADVIYRQSIDESIGIIEQNNEEIKIKGGVDKSKVQ
ncbi:Hsp70 family protein [Thermosynechococcus sp. FA-CM-4201]